MRNIFRLQTLLWAVYAAILFLVYHLVIKVAFLDGSWIALIVFVPVLILGLYLIRPEHRKEVAVFTIGFLLLDRAFKTLETDQMKHIIQGVIGSTLVIVILAKLYGKLRWNAIIALLLIAFLGNFTFNRDNLAVLNHFYVKWESPKLYQGEWADFFPITLYDVDHDGKMEIITYGNKDEVPPLPEEEEKPETPEEKLALAEKIVKLKTEPISMYIFTYKNGEMVRIPNEQVSAQDMAAIKEQMPVDYPGFPYYMMKGDQLLPNVQRQPYSEGMMQAGTAPYRAFLLDMLNVDKIFSERNGQMDSRSTFGHGSKFTNLSIRAGKLSGTFNGVAFSTPTTATKLLDTMRLPGGKEGLILLGENLTVMTVNPDGTTQDTYTILRKEINGLATSDIIVADIDHDNVDEMLVANTPSYVLKPLADGKWDVLWVSAAKDKAFRFSNFATVGNDPQPEIIAKAKSWVSNYYLRYLAGFHYTPQGLEQTWKIYLPLINVQIGDVDGDKQNEIVASIYGTHQVLVLKQHNVPVMWIVILLFAALVGYGLVRRFRHVS
ncbi:UNVERIFIED_CONTAM: hypothetical protein ABID98_003223 [Brevibacillus sp. OAP136]